MKPDETIVKNLLQSISSPQPSERMRAKELLIAFGHEILDILDDFAEHSEFRIRRGAIRAFNWIHESYILNEWRDYLVTQDYHGIEFGALLIAQAEDPNMMPGLILEEIREMELELKERIWGMEEELQIVHAMNDYFFGDLGFSGNMEDYYDPRNSLLPDILERRVGIPISLSVVYMSLADRVGLKLHGVGMPGHFIVGLDNRPDFFIDVFGGGRFLSRNDCIQMMQAFNVEYHPEHLLTISKTDIYVRMLRNLIAVYHQHEQPDKARFCLEQVLVLDSTSPVELFMHASLCAQLGKSDSALADLRQLQTIPEQQRMVPEQQLVMLATRLIAENN